MSIGGDASKARLIAVFIDHFVAFALILFVVALVPEEYPVVKGVLFFLVYLAYFVVLEALWSRTLGKYFQGLMVRKLEGSPGDWPASLIGAACASSRSKPLLFGGLPAGIVIISTSRKQRIGDLLTGTIVVSDKLQWAGPQGAAADEASF